MLKNIQVNTKTSQLLLPKAGTEIYILPQKTDFSPIDCIDPPDNSKLTDDPERLNRLYLIKLTYIMKLHSM
jgi:hypothetical protein